MIKYKTRKIGNGTVFLIGWCPGKQRKKDNNFEVFHGNRTGDFIEKMIADCKSVYLTNVFNYYVDEITDEMYDQGLKELKEDILALKPYKCILLGRVASLRVRKLCSEMNLKVSLTDLEHPSYVLRFNKDKDIYTTKLKKVLNEQLPQAKQV